MVDPRSTAVCCMCGDIGFSDKLFRCHICRDRIQHSYCSNYYGESAEPIEVCDWCRSDQERSSTASTAAAAARNGGGSSKKYYYSGGGGQSEYAGGNKLKQHDHQQHHSTPREEGGAANNKGKSGSGTPSPRGTTRRYKLLKDVMC